MSASRTVETNTALPGWLAGCLVFFSSGTVLVLEILGVRLMAPFVGSSLDTYTAIIGTVLAGISVGTYLGGWLADRLSPAKMLGPVLLISGITTLFIVPVTRLFGEALGGSSASSVILLSIVALLLPAAVLSAVSPIVVKLQLASIEQTGTTVGQLSAIGTAGAIGGTFLTGFVLLAYFRTSAIVITIGTILILCGIVLTVTHGRSSNYGRTGAAAALALIVGVPLTIDAGRLCDRESPYYCMRLVSDPANPSGRTLVLDRLSHSYVDLAEPTFLDFWYIQAMAKVLDAYKPGENINALTVGGGGFTLPRYIDAKRPGSTITSLEIDPNLVEFNRERLGLNEVQGLTIETGDARSTIQALKENDFEYVVADAFGNESVPWHLSTVEFAREIDRVLTTDGVVVMNVIDFGTLDLLRAELRTLKEVFPHVALIERRTAEGRTTGNFVVVASPSPIDAASFEPQLGALEEPAAVVQGQALDDLIGNASILTDDYAPADQLLANNLRSRS